MVHESLLLRPVLPATTLPMAPLGLESALSQLACHLEAGHVVSTCTELHLLHELLMGMLNIIKNTTKCKKFVSLSIVQIYILPLAFLPRKLLGLSVENHLQLSSLLQH